MKKCPDSAPLGKPFRKYGESDAYRNVTNENRGKASIGPDGSLAGYSGGLPFATEEIDCERDPEAATKIIWNFSKAWNGDGSMANFRYTSWDRGEQLPIQFEGTSKVVHLKDRVERFCAGAIGRFQIIKGDLHLRQIFARPIGVVVSKILDYLLRAFQRLGVNRAMPANRDLVGNCRRRLYHFSRGIASH